MKIRMLKTCASPYGGGPAGVVLDLPDNIAVAIVGNGDAVPVRPTLERAVLKAHAQKAVDVSQYHIGGGYYDLPTGERVRGKGSALSRLMAGDVDG